MKILILLTVFTVVIAGCSSSKPKNVTVKNIKAKQLKQMMANKDFVLIDVHTPEQKHIVNTDLVIRYNHIVEEANKLPADKSEKLVVYCRSGHMSLLAARDLINIGYTNVYNLEGGINAWIKAGYQTE